MPGTLAQRRPRRASAACELKRLNTRAARDAPALPFFPSIQQLCYRSKSHPQLVLAGVVVSRPIFTAGSFLLRKGGGEGLLNSPVDDPQRHTSRYPLSLGKCQQVVEDHLDGSAFTLPDQQLLAERIET